MQETKKPGVREVLGLPPSKEEREAAEREARMQPILMHDPGVTQAITDMNIFRSVVDVFLFNNGDVTFEDATRVILNGHISFREEAARWNAEIVEAREKEIAEVRAQAEALQEKLEDAQPLTLVTEQGESE